MKRFRGRRVWVSRLGQVLARWGLLRSLEQHIVICGFPRAGSTLLHAWLTTAIPHLRAYGREHRALSAAQLYIPGLATVLLTKRPNDIHELEAIRAVYAGSRTQVKFLLTTRDPRAVLVSCHVKKPDYYVSLDRWRETAAAVDRYREDADVFVVPYEDLITTPAAVEARVAAFLGTTLSHGVDTTHTTVPAGFKTTALNGVRPLDPSRVRSWEQPQHAARLADVLTPEVVAYLTRWGYQ